MNTGWVLGSAVASFIISAFFGRWLVPKLRSRGFVQTIQGEGSTWHHNKQGIPTMGGLIFILASVVTSIVCVFLFSYFESYDKDTLKVVAGLAMALAFGGIGFTDDYIKVKKKREHGLKVKHKLILQFFVASAYLLVLYLLGVTSNIVVPYFGIYDLGVFYWILSAIGIVAVVNAVGISDGTDGLVGTMSFFCCLTFMLLAAIMKTQCTGIAASALAGSCLGFLLWNLHPAKVVMGDVGSLFLGGYLCSLAFSIDLPLLLLVAAAPFILEMLSVVIQVTYFKLTNGKRLFKMSPIHHHFEKCGWSEVRIVVVFSVATAVCGIFAVLITLFGLSQIA